MKQILFFLIAIQFNVFAQSKRIVPTFPINSEVHISQQADSSININFIYKIPYDFLVFEKSNEGYKAAVQVQLEISNKDSLNVFREFKEHKIGADNFELTNSKIDFIEGLIQLNLISNNYVIKSSFIDQNSKREFRQKPFNFIADSLYLHKSSPIIVNSQKSSCENQEYFQLTNSSNTIPFGFTNTSLLIPLEGEDLSEISIIAIQKSDTIINKSISDKIFIYDSFFKCENKIVLGHDNDKVEKQFFLLEGLTQKLKEGNIKLIVSANSKKKDYNFEVRWIDKPFSLNDPEKAIEILRIVEKPETIKQLLSGSSKKYEETLFNYWKKFDPTPETEFNEIMHEFYSRIDYADVNFRGISIANGVKTDRGNIYVKFGQPEKIERFTDNHGWMHERWEYSNQSEKYLFVDKKGNGSFTLIK